ncbi:MAG: hypothetical protein IK123_06880, partial [Lachnospiraceae bacterium]|nr:hypothetical protein [Lachnospiraceae bacterium]
MYYSSVGVLALIIHLIINKEILKSVKNRTLSESDIRYRQFQYSVMGYYVTDILWGLFNEAHLIAFAYADTVLYFLLMVLSVLLWIRYVIVYLNKEGRFNSVLKYAGYAIYIFVALHLVVNFFNPIIFTFDADGVYVPGSARHLTFILQFVLYTLTGIYTFFTASKTEGKDKIHNMAVGFTCIAMDILIILQVFNPLLPFYAMGCLIEICIIHSFFEQDEKLELDLERKESAVVQKEKEVYNQIATSLAEDYEAIYY